MRINSLTLTFVISIAIHVLIVTWVMKIYKESPHLFPKQLDVVKVRLFEAPRIIPAMKTEKTTSANRGQPDEKMR